MVAWNKFFLWHVRKIAFIPSFTVWRTWRLENEDDSISFVSISTHPSLITIFWILGLKLFAWIFPWNTIFLFEIKICLCIPSYMTYFQLKVLLFSYLQSWSYYATELIKKKLYMLNHYFILPHCFVSRYEVYLSWCTENCRLV